MNTRTLLLAGIAALGLLACDDGPTPIEKSAISPPTIADPSKADGLGDEINDRGRLSFEVPVEGRYDHDGQNEGYVFTAEAGAVISLENTHKGSTRNLDTQLFLYGPADDEGRYGAEPIAMDDDGGYGFHARIKGFTLPARGRYRVVMGTYMSIDRGKYRLLLSCLGGSCVVPCDDTCGHEEECAAFVCDEVDGCVSAAVPCVEPVDPEDPVDPVEPDPVEPDPVEPDPIDPPDPIGPPEPIEPPTPLGPVVVSATELITDEAQIDDRFTVRLTLEPTEDVTIWVRTDNADEAVVAPQKLWFCAPGRTVWRNGCRDLEADEVAVDWRREIEVRVFGVNDERVDDSPFNVEFEVLSADARYSELAVAPIPGQNLEADALPDYDSLSELRDDALLSALHTLLRGHTDYGYNGQNSMRTLMFSTVDVFDGAVESIYNGARLSDARDSTHAYQSHFNVEHTWPQGQFDGVEPMKSDLHHTYPCDERSNSLRSSFDYGMIGASDDVSRLGNGDPRLFQPRAERRGDIARAHFYMVARYKHDPEIELRFDDNDVEADGCIRDTEEAVLRQWHQDDPVSEQERLRNERVAAYQGNRNPFIDHPELVNRIADF